MEMHKKSLPGFTLIELIVVMAIIVTLSVIGFISYNGYVRDSRNATRTAMLTEANTAIERFMFTEGRPPRCNPATTGGIAACYFVPHSSIDIKKATAVESGFTPAPPASGIYPGTAAVPVGIDSNDWNKLSIKNNPLDPNGVYYLYLSDGSSRYVLFAVKENESGYSTIAKGYKALPLPTPTLTPAPPGGGTDAIGQAFGSTGTAGIHGFKVSTAGAIDITVAPSYLLYDGNTDRVPYRNTPDP